MKIYGYRLHQRGQTDIAGITAALEARALAARRLGGRSQIRMEASRTTEDMVYLDFTDRRLGHGPGRMRDEAEIADIALAEGEYFGEDTAVVIHRQSGFATVQYNHHGPKVAGIEEYLCLAERTLVGGDGPLDGYGHAWATHLTRDGYDRLRRLAIVRRLELVVNVPRLEEDARAAGTSLEQAIRQLSPDGTQTISIVTTAAAERNSALGPEGVDGLIRDMGGMGRAVRHARVKGRTADGVGDEIDLIEEQLKTDDEVRIFAGSRYAREERWLALDRRLRNWLDGRQMS